MKRGVVDRFFARLYEIPALVPLLPDRYTQPLPDKYRRNVLFRRWETLCYQMAGIGAPIRKNERDVLRFKNAHRGKRIFIIGNGPSLNQLDLTLLRNEITIGVNSIFLAHDRMGFLPTHYVVEDIFVAEDRADQINALGGTQKWFGNYLRYCLKEGAAVNWLNVFMSYKDYPGFPRFGTNAERGVWVGGSVTYICMQLAYFFGAREVYLIGFDHNYHIPTDAVIEGDQITSTTDDINHFHPDYFGKGYRWHDPKVDRMEKGYRRAKEFFEADGRRIFNATAGGKLEVFERVHYDCLFPKASPAEPS